MATPLKIISAALLSSGPAQLILSIDELIDVQAFDLIDMDVAVHHDGVTAPAIKFYTSAQRQFDDFGKASSSWRAVGSMSALAVGYTPYTIPDTAVFTGGFLSRWLRWEISIAAAGNGCMVDVNGMGRRKCG